MIDRKTHRFAKTSQSLSTILVHILMGFSSFWRYLAMFRDFLETKNFILYRHSYTLISDPLLFHEEFPVVPFTSTGVDFDLLLLHSKRGCVDLALF